jgi:leucyl aminopeptidase
MDYTVKAGAPHEQQTDCLIVGVFEKGRPGPGMEAVDQASNGHLSALVARGDCNGRIGQTVLLHGVPGVRAARVLVVGFGREQALNLRAWRKAIRAAHTALAGSGARSAVSCLHQQTIDKHDADWLARDTLLGFMLADYRFTACKSTPGDEPAAIDRLDLLVAEPEAVAAAEGACRIGAAIGRAANLSRELGNLPGNICTPTYLAEQASALQARHPAVELDILDEPAMAELGMHSLLSVSRGSEQEARLIVLRHNGGSPRARPQVLVGKGITFDTGGISLKPGAAMDEMKFDMCGAASTLGAFQAAVELELPINLVAIIASAENMPDGRATKPGDIVSSMSGKTIEILNTDAEGRLVLCDALTYAERFKPAAVIDMATLTGACIIALGHHVHGLMGNNAALVNALLAAGNSAGDRAWELPLGEEWDEQLKSNFADMQNIGGRAAGTITAGCFLARFTESYRWAHLDIAGTAWHSGDRKGASGRPVPLLVQYLLDVAAKSR